MKLLRARICAAIGLMALVAGCAYTSTFGFPIEQGDINDGQQAFIDHRCHQCHSVSGIELPPLAGASPPMFELGGNTNVIKSYSGLLTSIINPNHVISEEYRGRLALGAGGRLESPMPLPQLDNMTVRQLIDLVAFLDSRYILIDDYASFD